MEEKGFFAMLFDFSFSEFVTIKIVKVLYALALIFVTIIALGMVFTSFSSSFGMGLMRIIGAILFFLIGIISARVYMEIIIVLFKIAENTSIMAKRETEKTPGV